MKHFMKKCIDKELKFWQLFTLGYIFGKGSIVLLAVDLPFFKNISKYVFILFYYYFIIA